jgi:hypothetical protein
MTYFNPVLPAAAGKNKHSVPRCAGRLHCRAEARPGGPLNHFFIHNVSLFFIVSEQIRDRKQTFDKMQF